MNAFDGSPAEMRILSGQADWPSPDEATAERLLSGHDAGPDAPADQRALALVLSAAARPATERERSGEQAAVSAFLAAVAVPSRRAWPLTRPGQRAARRPLRRRIPLLATGGLLAVAVALGGTAAAGMLPAPLQRVAHTVFGAPMPGHSGLPPSGIHPSQPANTPGQSAAAHPAKKAGATPATGKSKASKKAAKAAAKASKATAKAQKSSAKATASPAATGSSQGNGNGNSQGNGNGGGNSQGGGGGNSQGNGNGAQNGKCHGKGRHRCT